MESEILNDERPIASLYQMPYGEEGAYWRVGMRDCTAIEVYAEPGPECAVPFIRIRINGDVRLRFPAAHGEIHYAPAENPDDRSGQGS